MGANLDFQSGPDWSILSDLAQEEPGTNQKTPENFGGFDSENTKDYIKDRYSENVRMLEDIGDKHMLQLYSNLMDEYPQLRIVKLFDKDIVANADFWNYYPQPQDGSYFPGIRFNFSHPETYMFRSYEDFREKIPSGDDRLGRRYSIKRLAFSLGVDWKECARNKQLVADEVFLHEFGHAYDFIENYLRPQFDAIEGNNKGAQALFRATRIKRENRSEYERQSPDGCFDYLRRSSPEWRKSERRLRAMGIEDYDEYLYARQQYYRDQPDEAYADKFAYDYITNHYDDYFTSEWDYGDKRAYVNINKKEIELDRDSVHLLGLKQGLGVEIDRLDAEKKSIKHISGFLALNMYVGKSLYLYENGDPKNPGEKWRICKGISEMTLKPVRNEETGKINHYVFFKDEDGVEYHISRTKEEPESILCSPDEMAKELGLKVGDKVQLIKHLSGDARALDFDELRNINTQMVEGKVLRIDGDHKGENVVINYQIGNTATGLNYPPVRKWKRWYVGDYEILPLPEDMK